MGIWDKLVGKSNEIRSSSEGFDWGTSGSGTSYLLVTVCDGQPNAELFDTARTSRARLCDRIAELAQQDAPHLLLGTEAHETFTNFYQLDPDEAPHRLNNPS